MRKQFLLNILFLVGINLIIKPFWIIGIDRTIQNEVGSTIYGSYFVLFGFSFLFNSLLDFGVTNYNTWSVAKNSNFLHLGYQKLAKLKLIFGLIYLLITLIIGFITGFSEYEIILLLGLSISQFLLSFILFQRSVLAGLQLFWLDSIFSVLDKLLLIFICGYLLWFSNKTEFNIEWLVYAQLSAYTFVFILLAAINHFMRKKLIKSSEPDSISFRTILLNSYPFALIVLFMIFYYRIDGLMIEQLLNDGAKQAGYYAQSFRLFDVTNNFVFLFTGILFPMFSKALFLQKNITKTVLLVHKLLAAPALFFIPLAFCFSNDFLALLYTENDNQSQYVLILLSISYLGLVWSSIYGTVLTANGNLSSMIKITGLGFALNIVLNGLLIPKYGIPAAAATSAFSQILIGILMFVGVRKKTNVKIKLDWQIKYTSLLLLLILIAWIMHNKLPLLATIFTINCLALTSIIGLKLIDIKNLRHIKTN